MLNHGVTWKKYVDTAKKGNSESRR